MTSTQEVVGGDRYEDGQDLSYSAINEKFDRDAHGPALVVLNRYQQTPPGSPSDGDCYVVADYGTTGEFVGHEEEVATWYSGWIFRPLLVGEVLTDLSIGTNGTVCVFAGSGVFTSILSF
uniref:Uncharacterized protein n=1 Tax=viral metagenome TaxID=1070528 RepID=A0A6M3JAQ6_9ZZZZ